MTKDVLEQSTTCGLETEGKLGTTFSGKSLEESDEMLLKKSKLWDFEN